MVISRANSKLFAGFVSVFVASFLAILKLSTGFSQGSMAVIASGLDSALDFLTSSVNLYVLYISNLPADSDHRYGHGKAEAIGGLFQSLVIAGSAGWLLYKSAYFGFRENAFVPDFSTLSVMFASLLLTAGLVVYQRIVIKKTNSILIEADSLHYLSDLFGNAMIILSLSIAFFTGWFWLDSLAGGLVSLYLILGSLRIFKQSIDVLMDKDFSDDYRDVIVRILETHSEKIIGYHDLRARSAGERKFLEFHLELPKSYTLEETHEILESVMDELKVEFPYTEVLIHPDPVEITGSVKTLLDKETPQFY